MKVVKLIIEVVAQTGSTNSDLLAREPFGAVPVLRLAWQQTHGRGTRDKLWVSNQDDSLTFSVGWQDDVAAVSLPGWSVVVGAVLCEILCQIGYDADFVRPIRLKWPNDLVTCSKSDESLEKVAGVLVETRVHGQQVKVVTGIGLNLRLPNSTALALGPHLKPAALCQPSCDWLDDADRKVDFAQLLVSHLIAAWADFKQHGVTHFAQLIAQYDVLANQPVTWVDTVSGQQRVGHCVGIASDGRLALATDEYLESVSAQVRLIN
jgi:BirA family transcriptional regulator, biotin operon repressor / biotin---[acetyl-CoA-carboxylase] ligase